MTRVLTVNAGSSSLKLDVVEDDDTVRHREHLEEWDGETDAISKLVSDAQPDAVGHRVVHGGAAVHGPMVLDDAALAVIRDAGELAPLHQPRALAGIDAVSRAAPALPGVGCFDTVFHQTLPAEASTYAVPGEWRQRFGVRRFGFHGLSHAYVARRTAELLGRAVSELRTVSAHLGSGASLCAIVGGRSVDTTMGMTPMEGLVMGTRPGSVDPGMILWLLRCGHLAASDIETALESRSGLVGVGGSSEMGELLESSSECARLAVDVYLHRLVGSIASMAAAMNGMDALVFTGGVGENAASIRTRAGERLAFLGVAIDSQANESDPVDADISEDGSVPRTLVVQSREDLEIARQVRACLDAG